MAVQKTNSLPSELRDFYDRTFLSRALPLLTHTKWAQRRPIPKKSGKTIRFRKYNSMDPALVPIQEAITPLGSSMTYSDITATLNQYGDWMALSDVVQLVSPDPLVTEGSELLGEQSGLTFDTLMRNIMASGTNVFRANSVSTRAEVVGKVTTSDLDKIIRTLKGANPRRITRLVTASVKVDTHPIPPAFFAIVHTDTVTDLEKLTGWVPVEKYSQQMGVVPGEVGAYKCIRFVETTNAKIFAGEGAADAEDTVIETSDKADVYATLIFGADAYGECPLSGESSGIIVKSHSTKDNSDTSDPLNQRSTLAWKALWTGTILQDAWMIRYEHAVSA